MNICDQCNKEFEEEPEYLEGAPWQTTAMKVCLDCYERI